MPRRYHSASSDALGQRCRRAWYYRYVAGIREPQYEWSAIKHYKWDPAAAVGDEYGRYRDPNGTDTITAVQRSTALGKAMHTTLERWYDPRRGEPDWHDLPGQIAQAGLPLLPHPERVHIAQPEKPLGTDAEIETEHGVMHCRRIDGVLWAGSRDLVVSAPAECIRLGIDAPDGWLLVDYKSSAKLYDDADGPTHSLTSDELARDTAALLYTHATCEEYRLPSLPLWWVYFETKRVRRAKAVGATVRADVAAEAVHAMSARARQLDTIRDEQDAEQNPRECFAYGGCSHHISAGGPCNAVRSYGQIVTPRITKAGRTVALDPSVSARFDKFKAKGADAVQRSQAAEPSPAEGAELTGTAETGTPPALSTAAKKRVRRTKAEMAAARAAEGQSNVTVVVNTTDADVVDAVIAELQPKAPMAQHPQQAAASDAVPAASAGVSSFIFPGDHGPLRLEGDSRDILTMLELALGAA